ncbi:hypothetical protein GU333_00160 [Lactococcus raffinolactis]|jgi:competence protein ComX|uniref:Competence protein ComX n=1 Tax=Pseudolactococcus raffinolactis TaxID=1366 RepID=A0A290PZ07_9LACT|nr:hypothetical protein [Lactococcus raffinolactis]ATC61317.1 hypothetical protein CMV25_05235 [Lactococcus raffinolactis]MBW9331735.1 hypothetical protein [Lactococcus raffinolactis]MDG4961745.1 hypothetical protein [Lactococcus raffinolactis]MDT2766618.1 hypothetical protein [Lactococcus raffinolactis]MDT2789858.1 hypothetical protein [Lactococcus raffinolactis]
MDQLEIMLKKIAPIIMNCQKKTAIPSWELDDYMQEGMIIALEMYHQILLNPPNTPFNFYVYFKVKFSCYLIDQHRKATAFKRKFDQLDYYELSETINLFDQRQNVSENVMYDLLCQEIHLFLTPEEVRLFEALKRGEKIDRNQKYRIKKKIMDYIKRYW